MAGGHECCASDSCLTPATKLSNSLSHFIIFMFCLVIINVTCDDEGTLTQVTVYIVRLISSLSKV